MSSSISDEMMLMEDIVAIPLSVQEHIFDIGYDEAVLRLEEMLATLVIEREELRQLARDRMRCGHETYDSRMFCWGTEERRQNVLEEIADAVVYLVSGPVG